MSKIQNLILFLKPPIRHVNLYVYPIHSFIPIFKNPRKALECIFKSYLLDRH